MSIVMGVAALSAPLSSPEVPSVALFSSSTALQAAVMTLEVTRSTLKVTAPALFRHGVNEKSAGGDAFFASGDTTSGKRDAKSGAAGAFFVSGQSEKRRR
jgi:hypothetical protein